MSHRYTLDARTLYNSMMNIKELLINEEHEAVLVEVLEADTVGELAAFVIANAENFETLSEDEYGAYVEDVFAFCAETTADMLEYTAEKYGTTVGTKLFKRISHVFNIVDEPWEQYLGREEFVLFSKQVNNPSSELLPPHHTLLIYFVLARCAEELPEIKKTNVTFESALLATARRLHANGFISEF